MNSGDFFGSRTPIRMHRNRFLVEESNPRRDLVPPNSPAINQPQDSFRTPSLFGGLSSTILAINNQQALLQSPRSPVYNGSSVISNNLNLQRVPCTPTVSNQRLSSCQRGQNEQQVPQISTPKDNGSPWISARIVPFTPIRSEPIVTKPKRALEMEDSVVPILEENANSNEITKESKPNDNAAPKKRRKRYLV